MHPKEGWRDGKPPIPGVSRRGFLRRGAGTGAALLGAGGASSLLARKSMSMP